MFLPSKEMPLSFNLPQIIRTGTTTMITQVATLSELESELRKALEPSRKLDAWLQRIHFPENFTDPNYDVFTPLHYTSSIDAAVELLERVLPDGEGGSADWIIGKTNGGMTIHARVGNNPKEHFGETPALALCLAVVRFLLEQKSQKQ